MRRSLSIFVLVLLLAPLAPLALAGGASALPICCRAGGAHHCTGTVKPAPSGDGFREVAHNCPYAHARLLSNTLRPQTPAVVPVPHSVNAPRIELNRTHPAAPVADLQSSRAPPAASAL